MNKQRHPRKPLLIAGPCAAESPEQITISLHEARRRNVDFVRISLWKPRTKPGFDGLKEEGIPLLLQAIRLGLNPATEVMVPEQAQAILDAVLPELGPNGKLMLWIGARNQNHVVQQEIAKVAAQDDRVVLMVKNQPWPCESHWEGIVEHVLASGIKPENVILCHRGFMPLGQDSKGLRNVPDSPMAMRLRDKSGLRMILDLSHTAGSSEKVMDMAVEATLFNYDGIIVEVHPNPRFAWTDARQQLTWDQLDQMLDDMEQVQQRAVNV